MTGVIVYGDPHGEWRPLLAACQDEPPEAVILIGDCGLDVPLRKQLERVFGAGIDVKWIPGNHDTDTPEDYDRLWGDHPEGNLHARSFSAAGIEIAGLGGVFKAKVWYPRQCAAEPVHATRRDLMRRLARTERWRDGLPLSARDAVFPEDVLALGRVRVDVLVTHEAPSNHRHGFVGIDEAAALCRAKLVVHGHHHESLSGELPGGVRVIGLAKAEVLRLHKVDVE